MPASGGMIQRMAGCVNSWIGVEWDIGLGCMGIVASCYTTQKEWEKLRFGGTKSVMWQEK